MSEGDPEGPAERCELQRDSGLRGRVRTAFIKTTNQRGCLYTSKPEPVVGGEGDIQDTGFVSAVSVSFISGCPKSYLKIEYK